MLAVRTPGAPQSTRSVAQPAVPPSPLSDRVGYSDHVRFRGYFPVHFIPAYNLPLYASQWPLPDTTQDREVVGRNKVNGKIAPKSNVIGVADPVAQRGRRNRRLRNTASGLRCSRGSYRQHAIKGNNVNTGDPFGSNESL